MSIAESLLPEFDMEMENTRKVLAAVPDGKWDWKPHPKSMSLAVLTGHVAGMASWGTDTMTKDNLALGPDDFKPFIPESTASVLTTFDKDKSQFREALSKAGDDAMSRIWSMTWAGKKVIEMPRIAVLRGMILNHMIHHRGQLTVYLRLLDAPVPGTYGPTADEKSGMEG